MVHDEHKPFGDDYDYMNDPEGLIYWKKGRVVPGMLFTFVMNEDVGGKSSGCEENQNID